MGARGYGRGTVYRRKEDDLWVGCIELGGKPRRRATFSGGDRAAVEAKMDAWLAEHRPRRLEQQAPGSRAQHMVRAREIARHTAAQWREKVAAAKGLCHYCKRPVDIGGCKDHVQPVSRGGSDGIDNVVLACWDCNAAKSDMTGEEFLEWAALDEFFSKPQHVTVSTGSRNRRISPQILAMMRVPRSERAALLVRGRLKDRIADELARMSR